MKTIKIIDLLNKIANGEEVPKKIKYREMIYHICYEYGDYESDIEEYRFGDTKEHYYLFEGIDMLKCLNDEVKVCSTELSLKEATEKFYKISEALYKEANKKREKKIPEIIDVISWDSCIHGVTRKEKELAIEINKTQKLLNQLIDYLKSKGDE